MPLLDKKPSIVYLIYIDESGDDKLGIFTALAIPVDRWRSAFGATKQFRSKLRETDKIYVTKELHAWKFVSGRGNIAPQTIPKERRWEIFRKTLALVTRLPGAKLFNAVVYPSSKAGWGFGRLLTRIDRAMEKWGGLAILVCDEGKENDYIRIRRRIGMYNPIPSGHGTWENGKRTKNITIDRIIEDPFFKKSEQSYFIQLVDFCAYSLLCKERPNSKTRCHLRGAFQLLSDILVREANRKDKDGIIRVK